MRKVEDQWTEWREERGQENIQPLLMVLDVSEMMGLLSETEVREMVSRLEQQEVDCQTASGTVPVSLYCELLAAYLACDQPELSQAKYLMMRIPSAVLESTEGEELNKLWRIGKNLWAGNTEEVFTSLAGPWSENIERTVEKVCQLTPGGRRQAGLMLSL